jgi:integrase
VSCGYDVHGRQVKQFRTWKPTEGMTARQIEKEVGRQAVLFEEDCKQGQKVTAAIKFEKYATDYLTEIAPLNLKAGTLANYHNYSKRVYEFLGHLRMDKITPTHIQKFIKAMETGERLDKYRKGALSAKTIKNHIAFVSSVFEYARKMQVLSFNPCGSAILPKDKAEELQQEIYSVEETKHILELLCQEDRKNFQFTIYFLLAVYTGFRRGELLGLEWKDFDFDRQTVSLNRNSLYTTEKGIYTDSLKTRTSYRSLKLPLEIMAILSEYKAHQAAYVKSIHNLWVGKIKGLHDKMVDNDRLFTQRDGSPMFTNSPSLFFGQFCKRHGIEYRKGHSLRHFNASVQIYAGVDVKAIQTNLGHSQASTTLNIYGKVFQAAQAASMEKIVGVLGVPSLQAV